MRAKTEMYSYGLHSGFFGTLALQVLSKASSSRPIANGFRNDDFQSILFGARIASNRVEIHVTGTDDLEKPSNSSCPLDVFMFIKPFI